MVISGGLSFTSMAQHQLRELAAVRALLHLHREILVSLQLVALQRVTAHVRVVSHAHGKTGTGRSQLVDLQMKFVSPKTWCIVIHVLDVYLDVENVQRVVHQRLEADRAGRRLAAHLLPVQPLIHVQVPVFLIHREVFQLLFAGRRHLQLARRQLVRAEPQVPRQRPHERASAQLLGDGVADPLRRQGNICVGVVYNTLKHIEGEVIAILSWFGCGGTFKGRVVHTSLGQVSQSPIHPDIELFQTQHINIFSGQPLPMSHHPH
uniref:Uncharacterized protein n=1 Tax=Corvus moneduloides TaxID=1196302 RepID=A0A8U7P4Z6_CORMO